MSRAPDSRRSKTVERCAEEDLYRLTTRSYVGLHWLAVGGMSASLSRRAFSTLTPLLG